MTDDAARTAAVAALVLLASLAGVGGFAAAFAAGPSTASAATVDAPVVAQTDGPTAAGGLGAETFAQSGVDADRIVLQVDLAENGTARWQVDYRVELDTENDTAAFESLQADIAANESAYTASFRDRIERTAGAAENATGREMTIRNVDVSTATESVQGFGTVSYSFQWDSFGTVSDGRIEAGDALAGFFLERDSRLVLSWPDGYEAATLSPEPDDRRETGATWQGPVEFGASGPQFAVVPAGDLPLIPVLAVVVVALGLAGGFVLYRRERDDDAGDDGSDTVADADGDAAGGGAAAAAGAGDGGSRSDATPDEELLSNEERVMRLLNERGGRVKQQDVAGEFDWTDAKTSQVVNSLKDEGEIDVFRLGRENVLVLPEESDL